MPQCIPKSFNTQSLLDLEIDTEQDITVATAVVIDYKKPSLTTGTWVAVIEDTTKIKYVIQPNDIDEAGIWTFQGKVTLGGRVGFTELIKVEFDSPIVPVP